MKKFWEYLKKMNLNILLLIIILIVILTSVFIVAKWARGVDSTYDPNNVEDGFEPEVLDITYYMTEETLNGHIPNEQKKILFFGNSPLSDDRDSKNNLCNLIADETGAEVVNLSIPDSYLADLPTTESEGFFTTYPENFYSFYWLAIVGAMKDSDYFDNYKKFVYGTNEIGDSVYSYLMDVDMNTVDSIVLMYDAADYLDGRGSQNTENLADITKFCGNMYAGIEQFQKAYPHIQIIVMSPTYAYALDEDGSYLESDIVRVDGDPLSEYAYLQLGVCQYLQVSFIDNIYGSITVDNADKYLSDNVHLNVQGRKVVAKHFAEAYEKSWSHYYSE